MKYVEEDDTARIWTILRDRFRPTTDVTLAQGLKHIATLRMADDGDMEAHIRDFTASKRRVEEHGVTLTDIVYQTFFLISMPMTYQMTVTAIESQSSVTLEVAQNPLLEEWRKRKGQPKGGLLMTAMHAKSSHKSRHKTGNTGTSGASSRSNLLCTHCKKKGHVESTCWEKYPHLKDNAKQTAASRFGSQSSLHGNDNDGEKSPYRRARREQRDRRKSRTLDRRLGCLGALLAAQTQHDRLQDPIALGESRYFLTFTDDATRMTYLFTLKSKTAKEVFT